MLRAVAVAAALLLVSQAGRAADRPFVHPRGSTIAFPAELFSRELPPTPNAEGYHWQAEDGARLSVYGYFNHPAEGPEGLLDAWVALKDPGFEFTSRDIFWKAAEWSGRSGDTIWRERLELGSYSGVYLVSVSYPVALAERYEPVARRILDSLEGP